MKSGVSPAAAAGWCRGRDVRERCLVDRQKFNVCRLRRIDWLLTMPKIIVIGHLLLKLLYKMQQSHVFSGTQCIPV